MDLGKHAAFIWASYGVAFAVMAALFAWIVWDRARLQRALAKLERDENAARNDDGAH